MPSAQEFLGQFQCLVALEPPFQSTMILQGQGQEVIDGELARGLSLPSKQVNHDRHTQEASLIHCRDTNHRDGVHGHIHALFQHG